MNGELAGHPPSLVSFDDAVTTALQSATPAALRPILDAISLFGGTPGWILIVALAFWWSGSRLGVRVALVVSVSSALNVYLKWIAGQPRPYFVSDHIVALQPSDGFGMPSGHAQGSASAWGALSYWARRRWLWPAAAVAALLAGLVRVYYGVHSTLQIVCGWMVGALVVLLAAAVEEPIARWWSRAGVGARWAATIAPSLLLFGGGLLLRAALYPDWETPADWQARHRSAAILLDPLGGTAELLLIDLGALARWSGALLGASLAAHHYTVPKARHVAVSGWSQRLVNTALGLLASFGVLAAGGLLIERAGAAFELLRFAVLFWVVGVLVPRLGERLGAARAARERGGA